MKPPTIVPENTVAIGADVVPFAYPEDHLDREPESADEAESKGPDAEWVFWNHQITAALTHEKLFRAEGEACERMYFGPQVTVHTDGSEPRALPSISEKVAMIHANVDVLKPLIYSETPQPVIRRRNNGDGKTDETDLMATEAVQRLCAFLLDTEDFDGAMTGARDDWLIAGRGIATVIYKATFEKVSQPVTDPATGQPAIDPMTGEPVMEQVDRKTDERASVRHREWRRLLFCADHSWEDMPWGAIEHQMTRRKIEPRFPDHAPYFSYNQAGLIKSSEAAEDDDRSRGAMSGSAPTNETNATTISPFDTATVWEIWDKEGKRVVWWSPACSRGTLDEVPDPLGLADFYPFPRPLLATTKGRRLTPRPDIRYYESRAEEIQIASEKMSELLNVIAVAGLIPASASEEFKKLFQGKNQLIPVEAWLAMLNKGNITDLVQWLPLAPIITCLQALQQMRAQAKEAMFEASGVSDVMRAATDPNETATAQQIKGRYSGLRLSARQREMANFALSCLRMMIDVATGLYDTSRIASICGLDLPMTEAEREAEIQRRLDLEEQYQAQAALHAQGVQMAQEMAQAQDAMAQAAQQPDPMAPPPPAAPMPPMEPPLDPGPPPEPPQFDKPVSETSWELVHQRIKDDLTRQITISIETSSTVLADEASDKEARVEFISAFAQFVQTLLPMVGAGQMPMATMKEMLLFGVRGFPKSRTLETLISQLPDELPPTPEAKEDASITVAKIRAEVDMALQEKEAVQEIKMKGVDLIAKAAEGVSKPIPEPKDPTPPPPARKGRAS